MMIKEKKRRISVDFSMNSFDMIEKIKDEYKKDKGNIISVSNIANDCVGYTLGLNKNLKNELLSFLNGYKSQVESNLVLLGDANGYRAKDLRNQLSDIDGLKKVITNYGYNYDSNIETQYITLKMKDNKSISFPGDWVVCNPDEVEKSTNAFAVECLNRDKYNLPIFLYFSNLDYTHTEEIEPIVIQSCLDVYPDFIKIINAQVKAKHENPDKPWLITNADEFYKAPNIGVFPVYTSTNLNELGDKEVPYNVFIKEPDYEN
jgi:hypothetical protein